MTDHRFTIQMANFQTSGREQFACGTMQELARALESSIVLVNELPA
jgi:hypothetical protein